jgi:hypothetical protein
MFSIMRQVVFFLILLTTLAGSISPSVGYAATAQGGMNTVAPLANNRVGCNTSTSCTTASIPANSSGHWIKYAVYAGYYGGCSFLIRDIHTRVVVRSGRASIPFSLTSGQVYGLYGWYRMEVYNCSRGGGGEIWNN